MARNLSGWRRQPHDPRDQYALFKPAMRGTPPSSVDLGAGMGPLLDQGSLGSCGPNTADECITFDEKAQSLPITGASRLFIYYWTRYLMGTVSSDSGVDNRSMMKALANYGFPPESLWPYDVSKFTVKPSAEAQQAAQANKISAYAAVIQSLDQMRGCIVNGRPFVFGFDVFSQMLSAEAEETGVLTDPGPLETPEGGHDVTIFAYDDNGFGKINGGAFKFRNHWTKANGAPWGDNGCGYISYSYALSSHASDFWCISAVPDGSPPAPNPVPPVPPTPAPGIKARVDAVFARAIAAFAWYPSFQQVLRQVQAQVDAVLVAGGFTLTAILPDPGGLQLGAGHIPPQSIQIIDAAFAAAALAYPQYAMLLNAAKAIIDASLPLL